MQADHRRWALLFLRWMATARNRFIAELVLWFVGVWWLGALLIAWAEIGHSTRIQNLQDAFYGVLVTMTTSGDSAVAPVTAAGRWIMAAAVLASKLLTALLCALAAAVLIERKVREDLGLKMFEYKDHVIVIGWNLKGPHLLRTLQQDPVLGRRQVVVMSEGDSRPWNDPMVHWTRSSLPVRGDALDRAGLPRAARIIILANYAEKTHADTISAVSCLMARRNNPNAPIVVELLDPAQGPVLQAAGATDIVGIGEVGGYLLAEAAVGDEAARTFIRELSERGRRLDESAPSTRGSVLDRF